MNHTNDDIEKVLIALGRSEASSGMEDRILQVVQARASDQHLRRMRRQKSGVLAPAKSLVFAVLLVGVTVILLIHSLALRPVRQRQATRIADPGIPAKTKALEGTTHASSIRSTQLAGRTAYRVKHQESLAVREHLAPSRVAAPLPMTAQETLLLRISQKGGSAELARIHDEQDQLRQDAKSEAEFQVFFGLKDRSGSR